MSAVTFALDRQSKEANEALWQGKVETQGNWVSVRPIEVLKISPGIEKLVFAYVPVAELEKTPKLKRWWMATRAYSLSATFMPCLAVLSYGFTQAWSVRPVVALLAGLGAVLLQVSINLDNDVEDHLKLIDLPGTNGGSGVIQRSWLSAREVKRFSRIALVFGVLCGLPALFREPALVLGIGIAGVVGAIGYSGPFFRLKYRGLGDIAVFGLCGPALTAGFSLAAFGQLNAGVFWLGTFFGFAAEAILHTNNLQDIEEDLSRGAKTLAARMGFSRAKVFLIFIYVTAFSALAVGVLTHVIPWACVVVIPIGFLFTGKLLRDVSKASGTLSPLLTGVRIQAAKTHLILGVLLCLTLLANIYGSSHG